MLNRMLHTLPCHPEEGSISGTYSHGLQLFTQRRGVRRVEIKYVFLCALCVKVLSANHSLFTNLVFSIKHIGIFFSAIDHSIAYHACNWRYGAKGLLLQANQLLFKNSALNSIPIF